MAIDRPDLAEVNVQQHVPFLADRIYPVLNKAGKSGTQFFVDVDTDSASDTGRVLGVAPVAVTLANKKLTFDTLEDIKRVQIPDSEIDLMGGLLRAQQKAARVGKRSILKARETALVARLTADAGATADILDSLRQAIDTAIIAIERVPGIMTLVCGFKTFRIMTRYTEVTNTLLRTGVPTEALAMAVRNVDLPTLASILGVTEILVGPDAEWTTGTAYLVMRPDPNVDPDEEPQIGRTIQYLPDGKQPFRMQSFYSDNLISEVVDTRVWDDSKTFNGSGIYELTGIDEGNVITTTTTTTTTTS